MSVWLSILLAIIGLAGGFLINAILITWQVGRKTREYDAYGVKVERLDEKVGKLERALAAHTGIANGINYEEE